MLCKERVELVCYCYNMVIKYSGILVVCNYRYVFSLYSFWLVGGLLV